jgi:hypothetical protein
MRISSKLGFYLHFCVENIPSKVIFRHTKV